VKTSTAASLRADRPVALALAVFLAGGLANNLHAADGTSKPASAYPAIEPIDPPENGFFTKVLSFHGILIKAPAVVVDEALYRAYDRMAVETARIPMAVSNIGAAGGELHIIGRDQVTTDLPEWRQDKHVPLYEPTYNGATRDRRTRGMGGLITSCGEENLLGLPDDRYRGSDTVSGPGWSSLLTGVWAAAMALGNRVELEDLPEEIRQAFPSPVATLGRVRPLDEIEKEYILSVLELNGGNQTRTAQQLQIGSATLYRKLKNFGLIRENAPEQMSVNQRNG